MSAAQGDPTSAGVGALLSSVCDLLMCIRTDKDGYAKLLSRTADDLEWFATKLLRGDSLAFVETHRTATAVQALTETRAAAVCVTRRLRLDMHRPKPTNRLDRIPGMLQSPKTAAELAELLPAHIQNVNVRLTELVRCGDIAVVGTKPGNSGPGARIYLAV